MSRLDDVVLFQLDLVNKLAKKYAQQQMDALNLGITVEQWVVLKLVEENMPISQGEIADKSSRDPASITRTLDLLSDKGFILKQQVANNRRKHEILLSEQGVLFVKQNFKFIEKLRKESVRGLGKGEIEELLIMLKKMKKNLF